MTERPYYSVGELCEVLNCSTKWMYQQLNRGNIPGAFRIGTATWFIDRDIFHSTLKEKAQTVNGLFKVSHFRS
jgi:predicted DNA-binding transcriptional regulator AlpA